jgi:hypothetical protein
MQTLSHQQQAAQTAIRLAIGRLAELDDWTARCSRLRLPDPAATGGVIRITVLGAALELRAPEFLAWEASTGQPAKPSRHLLALHYLLGEAVLPPDHAWITFREFPGGQFYWEPFRSRSITPLIGRMGNDLELLRKRLARFSATATPLPDGGLQAVIQALGAFETLLVYRPGDTEFPPAADLLFDSRARHFLCAEDASVIASGICLGLL